MGYEDVDEITRQAACENVKKIVNAIKLIKIKYYPNFASISEEDRRIFQELNNNLEIIASENDLHSLKNVLMSEVSAKYDKEERKEENKSPNMNDEQLLGCYGAIDAETQALINGNMTQARECQEIFNRYLEEADKESNKQLMIKYRREKFGELIRPKEVVQSKNEQWNSLLKNCCKVEYTSDRSNIANLFVSISQNRPNEEVKKQESDTNELQIG